MDRKLSPKLQTFQPPLHLCAPTTRPSSESASGRLENLPFAWSTCSVGLRAGVVLSSPSLARRLRFRGHRLTSLLIQRRDMYGSIQKKSLRETNTVSTSLTNNWDTTPAKSAGQIRLQEYIKEDAVRPSGFEKAQAHSGGKRRRKRPAACGRHGQPCLFGQGVKNRNLHDVLVGKSVGGVVAVAGNLPCMVRRPKATPCATQSSTVRAQPRKETTSTNVPSNSARRCAASNAVLGT